MRDAIDPGLVHRFADDLARLDPPPGPIGIALSGGPDSVALLLLVRAARSADIAALTVDHGLREASAAEAEAAAGLCGDLGVRHAVHRLPPFAPDGGMQAAAREMRYAALADWAARERVGAVLTAHHADDQAETVLMRLARGAGAGGLAGIRAARPLSVDVMLLRPLLGWRKAELEAICAAARVTPARDPGNRDPRFGRTIARDLLAMADWLDATRVAASAAHLAEADAALAAIADRSYTVARDGGTVSIRPDPLREIARRQVRRLLAEEFGARPDGPALERALAALAAGDRWVCADILCRADPPFWRFRRAPPRRSA